MVSGIYGGDARNINLKAAFPRMYALEQEFGSLFKAMTQLKRKGQVDKNSAVGSPTGTLTSFQGGMVQWIQTLSVKYQDSIRLNEEIKDISLQQNRYLVNSGDKPYAADELFISTPAYCAGGLIRNVDAQLSEDLERINYAPIAVVGLVFPAGVFQNRIKGFGYLTPSSEKKEVLGVLFDSDIFPGRCGNEQVLFRIMIGGARHPECVKKSKEELIALSLKEIQASFSVTQKPVKTFFVAWPKAIPQYDQEYLEIEKAIEERLAQHKGLHLVANYLKGISLNDCIESAYQSSQKSSL